MICLEKTPHFSKSPLVQALWEALYKSWNHPFEKRGSIQAYDVLASLIFFRENILIFIFMSEMSKIMSMPILLIPEQVRGVLASENLS